MFNLFRPPTPSSSTQWADPPFSATTGVSPTTQSEFFFYNLLLCSIASNLQLSTTGDLDAPSAGVYLAIAQEWLQNAWRDTGDFY